MFRFAFCFLPLVALFWVTVSVKADPCFDPNCFCMDKNVYCFNVTTFPSFPSNWSSENGWTVYVSGSFPSIPKFAFGNIIPATVHFFRDSGQENLPIQIDNDTFTVFRNATYLWTQNYDVIVFENFKALATVPTVALSNTASINRLSFRGCGSQLLADSNAFNQVQFEILEASDCGINVVSNDVFRNVSNPRNTPLTIDLINNLLEEIPSAFRTRSFSRITIAGNRISGIPANAFAYTGQGSQNSSLESLNLSENPVGGNVSVDAFNTLNRLTILQLDACGLTAVPTRALQPTATTLKELYLTDNKITSLEKYAFDNLTALNFLYFNRNPIVVIQQDAFYSLSSMSKLSITQLPLLPYLDVSVVRGTRDVELLEATNCPLLRTLNFSDVGAFPSTVNIIAATDNDLQTISPNFQTWFQQSSDHRLDISRNKNFLCNEGAYWMAKFTVCSFVQIIAVNTTCADTGVPLTNYLNDRSNVQCTSSALRPVFPIAVLFLIVITKIFV